MRIVGLFFCLFFIFNPVDANSQAYIDEDNPWILGVGFNMIYDSGERIRGLFNIRDNYNYRNPFSLSIEKRFKDDYGFEVAGHSNKFLAGKNINAAVLEEDINFLSIGGMFKYYITNRYLNKYRAMYEGYIGTGLGVSFYDGVGATNGTLGMGLNYYLTESVRLNGQVTGIVSIDNNNVGSNYLQYNLGVIIRLRDSDFK